MTKARSKEESREEYEGPLGWLMLLCSLILIISLALLWVYSLKRRKQEIMTTMTMIEMKDTSPCRRNGNGHDGETDYSRSIYPLHDGADERENTGRVGLLDRWKAGSNRNEARRDDNDDGDAEDGVSIIALHDARVVRDRIGAIVV